MGQQEALLENPRHESELRQPLTFEQHGVDRIPEAERKSTPWTFFTVCTGASFTLGSVAFGWLPVSFGLSFWASLTSITVGTLIGLVPLVPLIVIGSRTATNNSTSSGAHFGVRGRLIGSIIGLGMMLLGTAIAIWSSGGVLVAGAARLLHTPTGSGALALTYTVLGLLSVLIAVYGYHLLVRTTLILMVFGVLTTLLLVAAFAGHVDVGYRGGQYALGSFTSTWLLSVFAVGVGGVMTMSTIAGDWTRYISSRRYPTSRLLPVGLLAVVLSYIVPMGIGALVSTAFVDPSAPFPQSLVTAAPGWYAILLIPMALFGGLGWTASNVYSSGLDLSAIVSRLTRANATTIVSIVSVGLVLAGSLVWNAADSLSAISLILLAASAPWAAVIGIGYLRCGGRYLPDDLQVFNRRQRGGAYWYTNGWNVPAVVAWAVGCGFGLLTVRTTLYTGPLANIANGIDVSFVGSFLLAGALYLGLETLRPGAGTTSQAPVTPSTPVIQNTTP
ncbi:purine-cytosine permease family protein [Micromonospora olivasterospora]|uniref:Purine-cytosine permease-like protein n=1 Tax=Micromonospora olivasterospora TaxID=1880 RepID=A0A562IJ00_MICOL|nr:cytosine permease [Micromonospora olivasterospora]TWH70673.1 purine-cytosine permease-like protein [Micromonospora olivasterospora]